MPERSKSSVVVATYQPRFSSPTMFEAGTRTSSKKTSLKWWRLAMLTSGRTVIPGVFMSIRKNEMPRCLGASGSLRARQKIQSACCAPEVQIFWPLMMKSSPSRTARVCNEARSEPEPGSLKPWHQVISALRIAGRKNSLCSAEPYMMIVGPTRSTPWL